MFRPAAVCFLRLRDTEEIIDIPWLLLIVVVVVAGDMTLRSGDVLLLDCGPIFLKNHANDRAFTLVSEIKDSTPPRCANHNQQLQLIHRAFRIAQSLRLLS